MEPISRPAYAFCHGERGAVRIYSIAPTCPRFQKAQLGIDLYDKARGCARPPGVARNTLDAAGYASLDLRIARDIALGPGKSERELTIGADVFNITNRVN